MAHLHNKKCSTISLVETGVEARNGMTNKMSRSSRLHHLEHSYVAQFERACNQQLV